MKEPGAEPARLDPDGAAGGPIGGGPPSDEATIEEVAGWPTAQPASEDKDEGCCGAAVLAAAGEAAAGAAAGVVSGSSSMLPSGSTRNMRGAGRGAAAPLLLRSL